MVHKSAVKTVEVPMTPSSPTYKQIETRAMTLYKSQKVKLQQRLLLAKAKLDILKRQEIYTQRTTKSKTRAKSALQEYTSP